ncbi:MAG: DUF87 domain-containing protein [Thermorudis peleae]|nr:DUF87 domain-containing protein [Thermorudis peleae]
MAEQHLDHVIDQTERLGVIGSPSSTSQLTVDVLGTAVNRKLVGELALFRFRQDDLPHYALGQITEVRLRNIWHEDPTMRSLIRQRGRVEAVSERQDTHLAQMVVSAVFKAEGPQRFSPSILGTVPATGTSIHLVTDDVLDLLLTHYQDQIFYLGHVYGSKPKLPLWFKHFDHGPDGAGEAYHLGIFGKTGSGKSVLAKMILLAYARHRQMALLIIDPQGEFARDIHALPKTSDFPLPLGDLLRTTFQKEIRVLTVRDLVLDRWTLFEQILRESTFFERLSVPRGENRAIACNILADRLNKAHVKLASLASHEAFQRAWQILQDKTVQQIFYRSDASRQRFNLALKEADQEEFYREHWKPVAELFRSDRPNTMTVERALTWLLQGEDSQATSRPVLIIDLSLEQAEGLFWNETIQSLVIQRLLEGLVFLAEHSFKEQRSLNTLVIIDEAHRLAPRERVDNEATEHVRRTLVDAARTTRKYGLGWLFVSQTLSSLHPEILQQIRIFFFGFGLGLGQEFQSLQQLVGSASTALELYQLFRDPHSAFDIASRAYSFMTIGPVSPLSFSGTPLFFNAFNNVDEFLTANRLRIETKKHAPASNFSRPSSGLGVQQSAVRDFPEASNQVNFQPTSTSTGTDNPEALTHIQQNWSTIRSLVKTQNAQVAALLRSAKPACIRGDVLYLTAPAFHRERLNDPKARQIIEAVLRTHLGQAYQLRCVDPAELP